MIQDIEPKLNNQYKNIKPKDNDYVLSYSGRRVLLSKKAETLEYLRSHIWVETHSTLVWYHGVMETAIRNSQNVHFPDKTALLCINYGNSRGKPYARLWKRKKDGETGNLSILISDP